MITKYLSNWIIAIFIFWYILYKYNISLHHYINIYYLSVLLFYGFILIVIYDYMNNKQYEISYLIFKVMIHILPLIILYSIGYKNNKYSFETITTLLLIYIIYMVSMNKHISDPYIKEERPYTWNDIQNIINKT